LDRVAHGAGLPAVDEDLCVQVRIKLFGHLLPSVSLVALWKLKIVFINPEICARTGIPGRVDKGQRKRDI